MRRRGEIGALLAALLAHATLLGVAARMPGLVYGASDEAPVDATSLFEVELGAREAPSPPSGSSSEPRRPDEAVEADRAVEGTPASSEERARANRAGGERSRSSNQEPAAPPEASHDATPPAPGSPDEYGPAPQGMPRSASTATPGFDGVPVWSMPGVLPTTDDVRTPAPTTAPAPREVPRDVATGAINGTLARHDHKLGLDQPAAGVVRSTVEEAVRSSDAPPDAQATFQVRLGEGGKLLGVRALSSTAGNADTWERVAKQTAGALAGKALALRGAAATRGATVTVRIESKALYPAGSKKTIDVQPICAEEQLWNLANVIQPPIAGGQIVNNPIAEGGAAAEAIDVDAPKKRRFCIPIGIAAKGDLSNIAAHKQTRVSSTYEVTVPGELPMPERVLQVDSRAPWLPASENLEPLPRPKKKAKKSAE